jgi:hypothetical protein
MSIENIEQLINSLQIVKKQLVEQQQINLIDKEVLKKQLVQFYETIFFNNTSVIASNQAPIVTNVSNPFMHEVKPSIETVKQEAPIQQSAPVTNIIQEIEQVNIITEKIQLVESIADSVPTPTPISKVTESGIIQEEVDNDMILNTTKDEEPIVHQASVESIPANTPAPTGLNDMFNVKSSSLNERFQSSSSIADKFEQSNKSMNELIDLNKRLLFVDVLFSGNIQLYNQVLQHIDDYKSANEAVHFLEFNKAKLQINEKKEAVYKSFLEIIQKKFN